MTKRIHAGVKRNVERGKINMSLNIQIVCRYMVVYAAPAQVAAFQG